MDLPFGAFKMIQEHKDVIVEQSRKKKLFSGREKKGLLKPGPIRATVAKPEINSLKNFGTFLYGEPGQNSSFSEKSIIIAPSMYKRFFFFGTIKGALYTVSACSKTVERCCFFGFFFPLMPPVLGFR